MKKFLKSLILGIVFLGTIWTVSYFFIMGIPLYIKIMGGAIIAFAVYEFISDYKATKAQENQRVTS